MTNRRPRYFVRKVCGDWVATDGVSQLYEYVGPSKFDAFDAAQLMNSELAKAATTQDDRDYYRCIGRYAKRHALAE